MAFHHRCLTERAKKKKAIHITPELGNNTVYTVHQRPTPRHESQVTVLIVATGNDGLCFSENFVPPNESPQKTEFSHFFPSPGHLFMRMRCKMFAVRYICELESRLPPDTRQQAYHWGNIVFCRQTVFFFFGYAQKRKKRAVIGIFPHNVLYVPGIFLHSSFFCLFLYWDFVFLPCYGNFFRTSSVLVHVVYVVRVQLYIPFK